MNGRVLLTILLVMASLVAVNALFHDVRNNASGGAIDLRNRVTGARIASAGLDPYTYKWAPGEKEEFCDPYNLAGWPTSRTAVTPLVLAFFAPLDGMNYRIWKGTWLLAQYLFLAAGLSCWCLLAGPGKRSLGILFTLLFCCTASWRLHVDRGQVYVCYAALFLILTWLSLRLGKGKRGEFGEGLLSAGLAGLRPIFLPQLGNPFLLRCRPGIAGLALGSLLVFFLPALFFGIDIWPQYFRAMAENGRLYLSQTKPPRAPLPYPDFIEGVSIDVLGKYARIPFADSSVHKWLSFHLPWKLLLGVWLGAAAISQWVLLKKSRLDQPAGWWALAAWAVIADFLLPAYRYTYNDVLFWPMFLLGILALQGKARTIWLGISSLWLGAHLAVWIFPKGFIPVPSHLGFLIAVGVVAAVWRLPSQRLEGDHCPGRVGVRPHGGLGKSGRRHADGRSLRPERRRKGDRSPP